MLEEINPQKLFFYRRLDLVVKYLYAKDLLNECRNEEIENLYIRHILMRTGGIEAKKELGIVEKSNINEFLISFKELCFSLKGNGFDKNNFVPIANNKTILDGAHRIAASMVLNQNIYIQKFEKNGRYWDFGWFVENGFSIEDKMRILKGFVDINKENSAVLVIWNPMFKYLDHIKTLINKELDIVGEIELDFENNFIAFNNVILDIYETNSLQKEKYETILAKAELLQTYLLSFKVIVLTNQEKNSDKNIHDIVKNLKQKCRDYFDFDLPKEIFATMHSSDSVRELLHLSDTLLSVNNIRELKKRLSYNHNEDFLKFCDNCREECKKNDINVNDICIIGSAPMAVYGIKTASDIDFVTKYKYREKFGDGATHLNDIVDIASRTYHRNGTDNFINDDLLIDNDSYHFIFNGLKFANLSIVKERKTFSKREKDLKHIRKIELFENFIGTMNQNQIFKSRIIEEQERRKGIKVNYEELKNNINDLYNQINEIKQNKIIKNNKLKFKKYPKWFINLCCCFILKKKNRKHFRKKYSKK